jgi:quercetin 2,3-dioxygenase
LNNLSNMRTVKAIHQAAYEPIADLVTWRAMPTKTMAMNQLDPFIFLNHHGWQQYPPNNNGLPFGPHPHRGFETVTFILEGDLTHQDSSSGKSIIKAGGIQWMTAGSGLVHAEISSQEFKKQGGPLEILQLWVNLPAKFKMIPPSYIGLQKNEIPEVTLNDGNVTIHAISGNWSGTQGPVEPYTDIALAKIDILEGAEVSFTIPVQKNIFLYVVKGKIHVNNKEAEFHQLVEFGHIDEQIEIKAISDAVILFGHATPYHETFLAQGPFVMNTKQEIIQAYEDYNNGKFGSEEGF